MKKEPKPKKQSHRINSIGRHQIRNFSIFALVVFIILVVLIILTRNINNSGPAPEISRDTVGKVPHERPETAKLIGSWQRTDGGYILQIEEAGEGGHLKAAYYNPKPINVSKAEAKHLGKNLEVLIELWDENYPGSTYKLTYDPTGDVLYGEYFTPVMGQTFNVHFVRIRE